MSASINPWHAGHKPFHRSRLCAHRHTDAYFTCASADGVAHHAVEPDSSEKNADAAEDPEECGCEARQNVGSANMLDHRFCVVDRHGRIERVYLATQSFHQYCGIACAFDDKRVTHHRRIVRDALTERAIQERTRIFAQAARLHVFDHADDFIVDPGTVDVLTNRI